MSGHTPGPWQEPVTYGKGRFEIMSNAFREDWGSFGHGPARRIAVVDTLADALLIASAPELLAVVMRVAGDSCRRDDVGASKISDCRCYSCAARAAIAKAQGKDA